MNQLIGAKVLAAPHYHELENQAGIVPEGEFGFWIDGDEIVARPGDYVFRAAGKPHALWDAGDEVARNQEITSPGASFERDLRNSAKCSLPIRDRATESGAEIDRT